MRKARPTCFKLLTQFIRGERALALAKNGNTNPAIKRSVAMTTSTSTIVKALWDGFKETVIIECVPRPMQRRPGRNPNRVFLGKDKPKRPRKGEQAELGRMFME